jgi:hypothetical protein
MAESNSAASAPEERRAGRPRNLISNTGRKIFYFFSGNFRRFCRCRPRKPAEILGFW